MPQARLAFELIARIAYDADAGQSRLVDEMEITIRKQLTSPAPRYKSLGVLGGCCLLGRLGARSGVMIGTRKTTRSAESAAESANETFVGGTQSQEAEEPLDERRKELAKTLLDLMLRNASAPDGSFGFLLHELSLLVAARASDGITPTLHPDVVEMIKDDITNAFEDEYLHDVEALPVAPPHVRGVRPELALALQVEPDEEAPGIAVNLLPLLRSDGVPGKSRHSLTTLSATFQLLRVCEAATAGNDLEGVDAVLGCPLYLFSHTELDGFEAKPQHVRETICLALFHTIDWLRELINAFVTQSDAHMRKRVLQRLRQLLWMERTLDFCLSCTPTFQLPTALLLGAGKTAGEQKKKPPTAEAQAKAEERALKALAASKGKGKGKAVAPPNKKARKAREDVCSDSSDDDDADDNDAPPPETDGFGAGTSAAGGAAAAPAHDGTNDGVSSKPKAKVGPRVPPGALPLMSSLARLRPFLRGLSLDVCSMLTFLPSPAEQPESEGLELLETLGSPPSLHFLIELTHQKLRAGCNPPFKLWLRRRRLRRWRRLRRQLRLAGLREHAARRLSPCERCRGCCPRSSHTPST